jgi:hypothetical protein
LRDLYARLVFNILCGNTDDHARNHAAFRNGKSLSLTPAYDICAQARTGTEATQAMLIVGEQRRSQIVFCLEAASNFLLTAGDAEAIAARQVAGLQGLRDRGDAEAVAWDDGKLKRLGRVDMRRPLLAAFAKKLSKDDVVVVEATGNASSVAAVIAPHVNKVVIANPKQVRIIAHAKIKTDTRFASALRLS